MFGLIGLWKISNGKSRITIKFEWKSDNVVILGCEILRYLR